MKLFDVYPLYDVNPEKAKDVFIYDNYGNKYIDLYGGHAVISIGHSHPEYVKNISRQLNKIGFYSNSVKNSLQEQLADLIVKCSGCEDYSLFMCNSGAEANENALKLASIHTGKSRIIAFRNSFHGRSNAAIAATDFKKFHSKLENRLDVTFINLNDSKTLKNEIKKGDVCAVLLESIQGYGGLDEPDKDFVLLINSLCKKYNSCLIADEVQSGFGRTGKFFAFQEYEIKPHFICMAKGMGNGFPVGGLLINSTIKSEHGMLGTTFGGNHLACVASLTVLNVIEKEDLQQNAREIGNYFIENAKQIPEIINIKGKGLMLGIEFNYEVKEIRKKLIYDKKIFTGSSGNKNLLRILPPLTIKKKHIDIFFESLKEVI
ncbi:MAG: aspartate aminotransferase family protein [Flavobacteriales bacterium]|nr:aspartate aminotransferase family protein [Flavobacteriales bacterium]